MNINDFNEIIDKQHWQNPKDSNMDLNSKSDQDSFFSYSSDPLTPTKRNSSDYRDCQSSWDLYKDEGFKTVYRGNSFNSSEINNDRNSSNQVGKLKAANAHLAMLNKCLTNINLDKRYLETLSLINDRNAKKRNSFFYKIFKIFPSYKMKYVDKALDLSIYFKIPADEIQLLISYLNVCVEIFDNQDPNQWNPLSCFNIHLDNKLELELIDRISYQIKNINQNYIDKNIDVLSRVNFESSNKSPELKIDFPFSASEEEKANVEEKELRGNSDVIGVSNKYSLKHSSLKINQQKKGNPLYDTMHEILDVNLILIKKLNERIGRIVLDINYYDLFKKNKKSSFFHSIARFFGRKKNRASSLTFKPEKYYTVRGGAQEAERNLLLITNYINIVVYELSMFGLKYDFLTKNANTPPENLSKIISKSEIINNEIVKIFENAMNKKLDLYLNKELLKKVSFFSYSPVEIWNQISTGTTKEL